MKLDDLIRTLTHCRAEADATQPPERAGQP
jgi:hypothetical protein